MAMEIGNMSSTELKALGFDISSQMNNLQANLNVVLKQIEVKVKQENMPTPKPPLEPKKSKKVKDEKNK